MAPHRLIEGAAFDPEVIALLIQAYETAVKRVGKDQPLPVLETLAKRIIEIAVHRRARSAEDGRICHPRRRAVSECRLAAVERNL